MNVSLTPELDRFIAAKVEEGTYASQSEVVRAGLRLLLERERLVVAQLEARPVAAEPAVSSAEAHPIAASAPQRAVELPRVLWHHFPDLAPERLRLPADRDTLLARLLGTAQLEAVRWLRANVPAEELAEFLRTREGAGLDPKSLRFWGVLLDLPRWEVDRWIARTANDPWATRTRR